MAISELLTEAMDGEDFAKSAFRLIKYNQGLWKSEKQAKFLYELSQDRTLRDSAGDAWARRQGLHGHAVVFLQMLKGFGVKTQSKIRWSAHVFVVDGGGIVASGRVKVIHPKGDSTDSPQLDWTHVDVRFTRPASVTPPIWFDPDKAKAAAKAKTKPHLDMLHKIPGWESKDILVSFNLQLMDGRPLSLRQLGVLQRMVPTEALLSSVKSDWEKALAELGDIMTKKALPGIGEYMIQKEEQALAALKGREPEIGEYDPDPESTKKDVRDAIANFHKEGRAGTWLERQILWIMDEAMHGQTFSSFLIYGDAYPELRAQIKKAVKAKKPTKKGLDAVQWATMAVDHFRSASKQTFIDLTDQYQRRVKRKN